MGEIQFYTLRYALNFRKGKEMPFFLQLELKGSEKFYLLCSPAVLEKGLHFEYFVAEEERGFR